MRTSCHSTGGCCAIGYRRVSTSEQANSGLGLDAQLTAIVAGAAKFGLRLAATFTDAGVSGGLPLEQRQGLLAALDALGKGDTLIVARRDRLGRSVLNVAMLARLVERKGARIYSAAGEGTDDDGPTSVLMRQIIDAFAEYERAIIRARTKAALQAKKARGERVGGVPYGSQVGADGRALVPQENEQRVLRIFSELRAAGWTLRGIADELNRQGFRTRTDGPWRHQYVWNMAVALEGGTEGRLVIPQEVAWSQPCGAES
jgi:site-specific DNA recombinase